MKELDKKKRDEYIKCLTELSKDDDIEVAHMVADNVLCEILDELGYSDITDQYTKVPKWYA